MKKTFYYLTILTLISVLFIKCKKDDSTSPDDQNGPEEPTGDWIQPIGIPRPTFGIEEK